MMIYLENDFNKYCSQWLKSKNTFVKINKLKNY